MLGPMVGRVCRRCPYSAVRAGLCAEHAAEAERARGSSTARGYGADHQRRRAAMIPHALGTACPVCHLLLLPGQPLALAHTTPLVQDPTSVGDAIVHDSGRCNPRGTHPANTGRG